MQAVFQRNLKYGVGGFGNCILAKPSVIHRRFHPLPGDGEPRGLLEVTASPGGHEATIFCTHLSTEKDVRVRQARKVAEILRGVRTPHVLCGDMNDVMGSETLSALLEDAVLRDAALEAAPTYIPSLTTKDHRRIDFVLADLRFDVKNEQVIDTNASDHRPVVVDLESL
jgi:endonuclease/exonuclease/phosphatase family metal-dependent hydrolase